VVVFTWVEASTSYKTSEDGYDQLAYGIYHHSSFSYYPNPHPTVLRGPAYPTLVAAALFIKESWYPFSIQFVQALLHGLTCLLAYGIARSLFGSRSALIVGVLCAAHPYLIWYSSRVVTETLSILLFTGIVSCCITYVRSPKPILAILVGMVLALASLCKGTFLPFVFVVPALLFALTPDRRRARMTAAVFCTAILVIAPWTIRNYTLTQQLIPVHSLLGYNLRAGDILAEFYERAPFSYFQLLAFKQHDITAQGDTISHPWMRSAETVRALEADNELTQRSLLRYQQEPILVIRKLLLGPIMFWTLSSSPSATMSSALLQTPLLVFFTIAAVRILRRHRLLSIHALPIALIAVYFATHIPVMALARFSVVLIPTMLAYAITVFAPEPEVRTSPRLSDS